MKNLNIKNLAKLVLIDLISVVFLFVFSRYILSKIKEFYYLIQSLTPKIDSVSLVLQQNTSLFDMNALSNNLDVISKMSNNIILLIILLFVSMFFIYNISQSINWNLVLNNFKFKNYKTYVRKFALINIPILFLLGYIIFQVLVKLKPFILNYWFESVFNAKEFVLISLMLLAVLLVIYSSFYLYSLLNQYTVIKSAKLYFKDYKHLLSFNFVIFLLSLLTPFSIFIILAGINPNSTYIILIALFVSTIIADIFRIYLANKLIKDEHYFKKYDSYLNK